MLPIQVEQAIMSHGYSKITVHAMKCADCHLKVSSSASFWLEERPLSTAMLSTSPARGMEAISSSLEPPKLTASVLSCGTLHNFPGA